MNLLCTFCRNPLRGKPGCRIKCGLGICAGRSAGSPICDPSNLTIPVWVDPLGLGYAIGRKLKDTLTEHD